MKRALALCSLLFAALVVAACGSGDQAGEGSGGQVAATFNQRDADFASAMVQHHEQALTMSELAVQQASSNDVKDLAARIRTAQAPEIDRMSGWLQDWGARGATMPPHGIGHEAEGPGMMSADQMAELEQASGETFDRLFLQMMIEHHQGAIQMAEEEIAQGRNADAKQLAQAIKDGQSREITEMKGLLAKL